MADNRQRQLIAYNPGPTSGTNLTRGAPPVFRPLMPLMFPMFNLLGRFRPQYSVGTPERGGSALAELASDAVAPPDGHVYASLVRGELTFPNPSESATMVGLPA